MDTFENVPLPDGGTLEYYTSTIIQEYTRLVAEQFNIPTNDVHLIEYDFTIVDTLLDSGTREDGTAFYKVRCDLQITKK